MQCPDRGRPSALCAYNGLHTTHLPGVASGHPPPDVLPARDGKVRPDGYRHLAIRVWMEGAPDPDGLAPSLSDHVDRGRRSYASPTLRYRSSHTVEWKHYAQKTLRWFVSHPGAGHFPHAPSPNRHLSVLVHSPGSWSARRSRRCWGPHCRIKQDSTRVFQCGSRRFCRSGRSRRRPRTQDEPRRLCELSCAAHGRGNKPGRESSGGLCHEERGHQ